MTAPSKTETKINSSGTVPLPHCGFPFAQFDPEAATDDIFGIAVHTQRIYTLTSIMV